MSSKSGNSICRIPCSQQSVYNTLSDPTNIEKIRNRISGDKTKDLTFDAGSISIHSPVDDVQLNIIGRDESKCVKLEMKKSPIPVNLWTQILPITDHSGRIKFMIETEVSPFIKAMAKKPL